MDDKIKDELESERAYYEMKEYEESGTKDDFKTWKLKKYIDSRFYTAIAISVGLVIGMFFVR